MIRKMLASVVLFSAITNAYAADASPIGFWKTIDDVSNQPKSIIQIEELPDHTLMGKVVTVFKDPQRLCEACTGATHNQPIVGLVVMCPNSSKTRKTQRMGGWRNLRSRKVRFIIVPCILLKMDKNSR